MCGLCGMLGGPVHWTDADSFARRGRLDRQRRVVGLNRVLRAYACTVTDWQGHAYLLSTFTGKTEIVADLAALWPARSA